MTRNYYRIMLGRKSIHAKECHEGQFIGGDWGIHTDLTGRLPEDQRKFNAEFIPVYLHNRPDKTKVSAGLACGMLYTICKNIQTGDIVLCPNGENAYWVGEVISDYYYVTDQLLPHRRKVQWYPQTIQRSAMSQGLQNSSGSIGTVSAISKYAEEIDNLIGGKALPQIIAINSEIEDPATFAMEKTFGRIPDA